HGARTGKARVLERPAISGGFLRARAHSGCVRSTGEVHRPDTLISDIGDVQRVVAVETDPIRLLEQGVGRWAAIAGETGLPTRTGDGADCPGPRGYSANAEVQAIDDIERVLVVEAEAIRLVEHGVG